MQTITLGEIALAVAGIVAFFKGIEYLWHKFVSLADAWLNKGLKPIHIKLEELDERLTQEEIETMRPELMRMLSIADRGKELSEFESKHLYAMKRVYNEKGGDSYIDDYFDQLRKEGKL